MDWQRAQIDAAAPANPSENSTCRLINSDLSRRPANATQPPKTLIALAGAEPLVQAQAAALQQL